MRFTFQISGLLCTLVGITLIAFFLVRAAPGDPVLLMAGERGASEAEYQATVQQLGLDRPLFVQYFQFLVNAIQGDLGNSIVSNRPVVAEFMARWPASIELGLASVVLSLVIGIPSGVLAAVNHNKSLDRLITAGSLVGYSIPVFWWGLLLILFFSIYLDLTPVSGRIGLEFQVEEVSGIMLFDSLMPKVLQTYGFAAFESAVSHLLLPVLTMSAIPVAIFSRMTRSSMLDVLSEDYILAARAKGLSRRRVIFIHALRNALIPIITVGSLFFVSAAVTGAILTETIFGWPGIGSYLVSSVHARDYPVIQGSILLIGMFVVFTNVLTDLAYRKASPRLRK